jgi:hypothetical protein
MKNEKMTLADAYNKSNQGDTLKGNGHSFIIGSGEDSDHDYSLHEGTQPIWEIIPAEPVIIIPLDYVKDLFKNQGVREVVYHRNDLLDLLEKFAKNGQFKDRKNTQPLIDAVDDFIQDIFKNTLDKVDSISHLKRIEYARTHIELIK